MGYEIGTQGAGRVRCQATAGHAIARRDIASAFFLLVKYPPPHLPLFCLWHYPRML